MSNAMDFETENGRYDGQQTSHQRLTLIDH